MHDFYAAFEQSTQVGYIKCARDFFFEKIRSRNIETLHVPLIRNFRVERISNRKSRIHIFIIFPLVQLFQVTNA